MLKDKLKNKKTRRIILVVLILVVILILFLMNGNKNDNEVSTIETESIEKRTLVSSISGTGTIVSSNANDIITSLTGLQIKSVNVEVGDTISVGDVICTFDTENIEDNLKAAQKDLSTANAQNSLSVQNAQRNLSDTITSRNYVLSNAEKEVNATLEAYNLANSALGSAKAKLTESQTALGTAQTEAESLKQVYESATSTDSDKLAYETATAKVEELNNTIATLAVEIPSSEANVSNLWNVYQAAVSAYNNSLSAQDSAVASAQTAITSSELSASSTTSNTQTQINNYKEQLEKGVLTATTSGVVTAVNVKEGETYAGTTIATIEGSESFIIEAEIDQYDISDIQVGMKVSIKTDATRDEELQGTVTYTAPKATTVSGLTATSSSNVTYTIKISLDTPNDRLRLGMTAKLSIISETKENVYTVPYDAIQEKESGEKFIYVMKGGSSQTEELIVTVGMETSYYVEIVSEQLTENMEVVIPTGETTSLEELITNAGATTGM